MPHDGQGFKTSCKRFQKCLVIKLVGVSFLPKAHGRNLHNWQASIVSIRFLALVVKMF